MTRPATAAYIARMNTIREQMERLRRLVDDNFGNDPEAIHYGHVGDLGRVEAGLKELLAIFGS